MKKKNHNENGLSMGVWLWIVNKLSFAEQRLHVHDLRVIIKKIAFLFKTTAGISFLWMPNTALLCFSSVEIPEEDSSDTLIDLANTFLDLANAPQHLRVNSSKFTSTFYKELFQA